MEPPPYLLWFPVFFGVNEPLGMSNMAPCRSALAPKAAKVGCLGRMAGGYFSA